METWSTHHLFQKTTVQLDSETAARIQRYANQLRSQKLPVIFSLAHLGKITGIEYEFLHRSVSRFSDYENYQYFTIKKRSGGRRTIHAANKKLFVIQKFINNEILQKVPPHPASFAFHSSGGIRACAAMHCGCKWLIKFDLKDFFYTIAEPAVFNVFLEMGYRRLLAFELARLCTTTFLPDYLVHYVKYNNSMGNPFLSFFSNMKMNDGLVCVQEAFEEEKKYPYTAQKRIGILPQGAPTSPMLSNLVARRLDNSLFDYAQRNGFVYTRYADDITFSSTILPPSKSISLIRKEIVFLIRKNGFSENTNKFHVSGPGARKMVLGLLVDGENPKLTKHFRKKIDSIFYSIDKYGIDSVASHYSFDSVYGFLNHITGLMAFINDVDKCFWDSLQSRYKELTNQF